MNIMKVEFRGIHYEFENDMLQDFVAYTKLLEMFQPIKIIENQFIVTIEKIDIFLKKNYTDRDSTIQKYRYEAKKMFKILDCDSFQVELLLDYDLVMAGIEKETDSKNSIKTFLVFITLVLANFNVDVPKTYRNKIEELQVDYMKSCETYTSVEEDTIKYITANVDKIEDNLIKTFDDDKENIVNLQSLVMFLVYARSPPIRSEWANIVVEPLDGVDKSKINWVSKNDFLLYLNIHKNTNRGGKAGGSYLYDFKLFPQVLKYLSILIERRGNGELVFQSKNNKKILSNNIGRYLTKIFNYKVNIPLIRKYYKQIDISRSDLEKWSLSNELMGHSDKTASKIYLKNTTQNELA